MFRACDVLGGAVPRRQRCVVAVPRTPHVPALFFGQPSLHPGFGLKAGLACRRVSCCVSHLPCLSVVSSCAVGLRACFRFPLWSVTWFPVLGGHGNKFAPSSRGVAWLRDGLTALVVYFVMGFSLFGVFGAAAHHQATWQCSFCHCHGVLFVVKHRCCISTIGYVCSSAVLFLSGVFQATSAAPVKSCLPEMAEVHHLCTRAGRHCYMTFFRCFAFFFTVLAEGGDLVGQV